jgi:predicted glycosyl hydrolase (DUF1957 family)
MNIWVKEAKGNAICRWCDNDRSSMSEYCYNNTYRAKALIKAGTKMLCVCVSGAGGNETAYYCESCAKKIIEDLKLFISLNENELSITE